MDGVDVQLQDTVLVLGGLLPQSLQFGDLLGAHQAHLFNLGLEIGHEVLLDQ